MTLYSLYSENTRRRQQLWPRFYSGRAHPHAHWWASYPSHQPGGVQQFFLHLTWTARELRKSSLIPQTCSTFHPLPNICWSLKHWEQFQAVTFPSHVRAQSAEKWVAHAQHGPGPELCLTNSQGTLVVPETWFMISFWNEINRWLVKISTSVGYCIWLFFWL